MVCWLVLMLLMLAVIPFVSIYCSASVIIFIICHYLDGNLFFSLYLQMIHIVDMSHMSAQSLILDSITIMTHVITCSRGFINCHIELQFHEQRHTSCDKLCCCVFSL